MQKITGVRCNVMHTPLGLAKTWFDSNTPDNKNLYAIACN